MNKPCIDCGTIGPNTRCDRCATRRGRLGKTAEPLTEGAGRPKRSPKQRGYDGAWKRLSRAARKAQPWCTRCGATTDLQLDHLPSAWERKAEGLPLRVVDVQVLCADCNRAAGEARPGSARARRDAETRRRRSGGGRPRPAP